MKITPSYWVPIPEFPRYQVNKEGTIKSIQPRKKEKFLKPRIDRAGYCTVRLSHNDQVKTLYVHRLVAQAFVPNYFHDTYVNHKNGNKLDNSADNLEWVSHSKNIFHAHRTGLIPAKRRRRVVVDESTGRRFRNVAQAARYNGIPVSTCRQYLFGTLPNPTSLQLE
jgi:hypothetical protein